EVGELRNVDELDAERGPRLHPRVARVGAADRVLGRFGERRRLLEVIRVLIGRGALAGRDLGPPEPAADQFLVLLARRPGNELPGVVLLLARLLDAPRPGVEPARALGLHDRGGGVPDLALDRGVR